MVGRSIRGYPLYQLLPVVPLAPAPARTREPGDDDGPSPGTAWEGQSGVPF